MARGAIAQQPLAFAVPHPLHGRTAVVATVRGGRTRGFPHRLIAAGTIAKKRGMFFCCVTTRRLGGGGRCGLAFLRHVRPQALPLPSLPLRLGMLPASFRAGATFPLPLGCLPAMQLLLTFRFPAIVLVVASCLKPVPAAFAETSSPPQSPTPGTRTVFVGMLNLSHGRLRLPWGRPGRIASSSGTLPLIHCRSPSRLGDSFSPLPAELATGNEERQMRCRKQRRLQHAKETGKETQQRCSGLEGYHPHEADTRSRQNQGRIISEGDSPPKATFRPQLTAFLSPPPTGPISVQGILPQARVIGAVVVQHELRQHGSARMKRDRTGNSATTCVA